MNPSVVIYHNPGCGTSRNTLALLREKGLDPTVVEYLKTGWTRPQLEALLARMQVPARAILRERGTKAAELGLTDPATADSAIIDAMTQDPALVERPIVTTPKGAALCRPVEVALTLL
ncbi:MAG: arsenate reductase (glutaredoxin) [Phenylobacterium sp.]|nr:arsenate reductase (glutaredoxin) [Phenylobacterium sp.]